MQRFINDANALLDHWQNALWLSWVVPVALMPVMQAVMRQWQEEEAWRAHEEAQRLIEATQREEEWRAKEAALAKWMAGPLKWSMRKAMPRKASKVVPIPAVEMGSDIDFDDTVGASQDKLQKYKDMWAMVKVGNIPAGYVAVSVHIFNRSDFDIDHHFLQRTDPCLRCVTGHENHLCIVRDGEPWCLKCAHNHKGCPLFKGKSPTKKRQWTDTSPSIKRPVSSEYSLLLFSAFTDKPLSVNVDKDSIPSEGLDAAATCSLAHHCHYFSHTADSRIQSCNRIIGWLNVSSQKLSCILKECCAQFLKLGKIQRMLKSLQHESSAQSEVVGDDNRGKGGSGQVMEGGGDSDNNGEEEVIAEASDNGTGFIDCFASSWSFVVGWLKKKDF